MRVILTVDDDGGRRRDGDVGVDEEERGAALDPAVEEDDRAPRGERRLFGEGDFDDAVAGADDRPRAGLLRGVGRPRFEPAEPAGGQALGVQLEALVEVEVERPDRGGWVPSVVPISASMWAEIGTGVRFGSFEGEMPPLSLRKRLPARMICGLAKARDRDEQRDPDAMTASARTRCFPVPIATRSSIRRPGAGPIWVDLGPGSSGKGIRARPSSAGGWSLERFE